MVHAELKYNPYLQKTEIRFNGKVPKINSEVEKFQTKKLQTWLDNLPEIFASELNGYDFDLDFSGNEADFIQLNEVFSGKTVKLKHKNTLESTAEKLSELDELYHWLKTQPNDYFLFDKSIENPQPEISVKFIAEEADQFLPNLVELDVEQLTNASKLIEIDLEDTPIVLALMSSKEFIRQNLQVLQKFIDNHQISQAQLFFWNNTEQNQTRELQDLGIRNPQIINSFSNKTFQCFLDVFPKTNFLVRQLEEFRQKYDKSLLTLSENEVEFDKTNATVLADIKLLSEQIEKLKIAKEAIIQHNNLLPDFDSLLENFNRQIASWQRRKTQIKSDEEAQKKSEDFETLLYESFWTFENDLNIEMTDQLDKFALELQERYKESQYPIVFLVETSQTHVKTKNNFPDLKSDLLKLKKESYVEPQSEMFTDFKNKLFKQPKAPMEMIKKVNYPLENWRNKAKECYEPLLNDLKKQASQALYKSVNQLVETYVDFLTGQISQQEAKKSEKISLLTSDQQKLQADKDWFSTLDDKLTEIENN
ncbi:hypothetical protein GHI93_07610 [Lactococcus hircilactis]|uniref:Uncharacterized protein n=1 Tax=Lactococcus hircilactis TaxID=1494462 RepID=A0A7X2D0F1_9LACT|nr:hypothetical protein [Lactococcus hircilactis]MQW39789.1 hypothetical protein [Lactococcus hircilactis]